MGLVREGDETALYTQCILHAVSIGGKDGFVQKFLDWDLAFMACVHIEL